MTSKHSPGPLDNERETLFEFPCVFPVKVMGRNTESFETRVVGIVAAHAELYEDEPVRANRSGSGTFVSVTVTVIAQSKAQLDSIYQDLTDCEDVLVAL